MTRASPSSRPPDDPLERAKLAAEDARDIAKDELRRLPDYSADDEEDTARHEVHVTVHAHAAPTASQPELDTTVELHGVKVTGLPRWLVAGLVAVAAVVTGLVAHLLAK